MFACEIFFSENIEKLLGDPCYGSYLYLYLYLCYGMAFMFACIFSEKIEKLLGDPCYGR